MSGLILGTLGILIVDYLAIRWIGKHYKAKGQS